MPTLVADLELEDYPYTQGGVLDLDRTFTVQSIPSLVECGAGPALAVCGSYRHSFLVAAAAFAQNGGTADFSHTLTIEGLRVPAGTSPLSFAAGQEIPVQAVPEPSTWAALTTGLVLLVFRFRPRRPTLGQLQ